MVLIDFNNVEREVVEIFENDKTDLDLFFTKLSAHFKTKIYVRDSLFVFDEVQSFPQARQLIKYLVADGRYDFIETGSLISLKNNIQNITIPSEEDSIEMFPLDFEEFLWAMGDETTIPYIRLCFDKMKPVEQLHRKVMNDYRQYMLVGGMPQAVIAYAEGKKDFAAADRAKKSILKLYRKDITRYAKGYENKVLSIFDTIPSQLSKKEKKYALSTISKDARFREYEDAFIWLDEAMIVNPCFNTTDPNIGLELSADYNTLKLYMADTGLLVTHTFRDKQYLSNELYRALLFDKLNVNEGMFMENIAAQALRANRRRLYFYSRADKYDRKKTMQIDFFITNNRAISPVEVKSSAYREHSSLDKFRKKYSKNIGDAYVLYTKDVMLKDGVIHLPLYMAMFL